MYLRKSILIGSMCLLASCAAKKENSASKLVQKTELPAASLICIEAESKSRVGFQIFIKDIDFNDKEKIDDLFSRVQKFVMTDPCIPPLLRHGTLIYIDNLEFVKPDGDVLIDTMNLPKHGNVINAYTSAPFLIGESKLWLQLSKKRLAQAFPNYTTDIVFD
ncbi:hypothetical protein [Pseudoalteromonas undina]|uniref:Lipoprotein n=1 Tax=Pseudoalteromonas undina TaxID=43660 RepID=A0ABN0NLF1_9GAMM|nr:hypothetical protein [Pseudoalteromonas undina]